MCDNRKKKSKKILKYYCLGVISESDPGNLEGVPHVPGEDLENKLGVFRILITKLLARLYIARGIKNKHLDKH